MSNGLAVVEYVREDGSNPYRAWFDSLHAQAAAKVATAVVRLELGNLSRLKWISTVGEYRIDRDRATVSISGRTGASWSSCSAAARSSASRPTSGGRRRCGGTEGGSGKAASQEVNGVALTQDFKQTVVDRVRRDPEFAKALLDEAATLFLNGEADTARLVLRDLVNATVGFEALAAETAKPPKSLHRMLSKNGNPTMDNLAAILRVVRKKLGVEMRVRAVRVA
jgi:DNA-binding phage protein